MNINAYLTFPGTCADAVAFYTKALGAEAEQINYYKGSPMAAQMPAEWQDKVMHVTMKIQGSILMASDGIPGAPHEGFKGSALSIGTHDVAEAERAFAALSEGGTVTMPLADQFWGARFGMLTDKFGVPWMVNCEPKK